MPRLIDLSSGQHRGRLMIQAYHKTINVHAQIDKDALTTTQPD